MAWSAAPPRPGANRRAARRRLTATAAGVLSVLAGLALLAMSRFAPDRFATLRGAALDAVAPFWNASREPAASVAAAYDTVDHYYDAANRAAALQAENRALRREAAAAAALANENARLKRLLDLREPPRRRVAVARVAGGSGAGPAATAIVSAGTADGVRPGQPALTPDGLLGRIVDAGMSAARVLLVTDAASRVPVRVARTGAAGLLAGTGKGEATIDFVSSADLKSAVAVGDRLITSGEGGLFPPGVPVALVVRTAGDRAVARPLASPATLGFVVIEEPWLPPSTGVTGGPPPPDQLAAEAAARAAAAKALADKLAAEEAARRAAEPPADAGAEAEANP